MSRLNLLLIPNFWLPHAHESGPVRTGSAEPQVANPNTEPAAAQENADAWSTSIEDYIHADEPVAEKT